jgi:DNA repair protein RecO (recombination protein O)
MRRREPAICLRTVDYSETSQVVHFLARASGVVHLLAKGSKRPKSATGGAIDLLHEGELVFLPRSSEALGTLAEFTETASHAELRRDARRLNTALYMIELVSEALAEADPHPEVFDLLHNALARLGQVDASAAAVLAYFQWRLLRHVGLLGQLDTCISCGRALHGAGRPAKGVVFSSREGGLLCGDCENTSGEAYRLSGAALAALAALRAAQAGRRVALRSAQADAVNRLLAYHLSQQLGKPLKMARHVFTDD